MEPAPISEAVSLALAPIFLLAGIGALLNVMTQRLGRVVDRARHLEEVLETERDEPHPREKEELSALGKRISSANRAIYATSASALLVCFLVSLLFIERLFEVPVGSAVAVLFIMTMGLLTLGLLFYLHEIAVATRSLTIRRELLQ
ncbi:MAG: DUF2721 domain-containing protein [Parvularcula sp.]|jgi:hypothetical protein|nr:DUF2721 domain-containing protein [Parvularcula sp.]